MTQEQTNEPAGECQTCRGRGYLVNEGGDSTKSVPEYEHCNECVSAPAVVGEGLKPCPFCGSNGQLVSDGASPDDGYRFVRCTAVVSCAETEWHRSEAEAIAAWNRRPTPSPAIPDREEIVGVLREARETILRLVNHPWSEWEGSDEDWIGFLDDLLAKLEGM